MSQGNLRDKIKELNSRTVALKQMYFRLRNRLVIIFILQILAFAIAIYAVCRINQNPEAYEYIDYIFPIALASYISVDLFFLIYYRKQRNAFLDKVSETMEISNEIVDFTEWTSFRRRLDDDPQKIAAYNSITDFYSIFQYRLYPSFSKSTLHGRMIRYYMIIKIMLSVACLVAAVSTIYRIIMQ